MKMNEYQKAMSKSPSNFWSFIGKLVIVLCFFILLSWMIEATDFGSNEQIHSAGEAVNSGFADIFYAIDEAFDLDEEDGFFDGTKYEGLEKSSDRPKKNGKKKK